MEAHEFNVFLVRWKIGKDRQEDAFELALSLFFMLPNLQIDCVYTEAASLQNHMKAGMVATECLVNRDLGNLLYLHCTLMVTT